MKYFCNPFNIEYTYQFNKKQDGGISVSREAADPSMILFKGRYYIFPSMTCGFLYSDEFELFESAFPFWDPKLFADDDGRLYFYWGSGAATPIYGIELNPKDLQPIGERKELILCDEDAKGFERRGENHNRKKIDPATIEAALKAMEAQGMSEELK